MPYDDLRKGRFSTAGQVYFVTAVAKGRSPCFREFACGRLVVREMRSLDEEGLVRSLAWVLMPDHLHWLFELREAGDLAAVMKRFKARSARSINEFLMRRGTVWQRAYYDHALREEEDVREIARYIVVNPLRAGLVTSLGEYPFWDAVWL